MLAGRCMGDFQENWRVVRIYMIKIHHTHEWNFSKNKVLFTKDSRAKLWTLVCRRAPAFPLSRAACPRWSSPLALLIFDFFPTFVHHSLWDAIMNLAPRQFQMHVAFAKVIIRLASSTKACTSVSTKQTVRAASVPLVAAGNAPFLPLNGEGTVLR